MIIPIRSPSRYKSGEYAAWNRDRIQEYDCGVVLLLFGFTMNYECNIAVVWVLFPKVVDDEHTIFFGAKVILVLMSSSASASAAATAVASSTLQFILSTIWLFPNKCLSTVDVFAFDFVFV